MEHIIKQLKKGAKHTRMSAVEKAEMKSALLRHVKMNPVVSHVWDTSMSSGDAGSVRNTITERHQFAKGDGSILSPFQINNLRNKKTMPLLIMLGLLMGGSVSFAAENTVPGDVLYPVKIHVNETVRGAVAVTPKAKAEWEVHLVERRLEEVEKLAVTPNALPEAQQIAQANLAEYTDRVKEHIAKFDDENDSEDALATAGDLADMLRTHEGVLAELSTTASERRVSMDSTRRDFAKSATITTAAFLTSTTSTTSVSTASTTPTVSVADAQSLSTILAQLRSDRGDAEKKHKDLEHKYHPEVQRAEEDKMDNGSDEVKETKHIRFAPVPAPSAIVGTSTATTQTTAPSVSSLSQESTSGSNEHEEIRATSGATSVTPAPATTVVAPVTTSHTESHTETHTETPKTDDHD